MRDPIIEQWLNKEGVTWHYEDDIPLSKVDRDESMHNQARYKTLNQDHVLELALASMEYELPAMVGYYNKELITLIDGNHRLEAYSLNQVTKSDFYIVDTSQKWVIDRLTRTVNSLNGLALTRDEKLQHAMYLVKTANLPVATVSRLLAIPHSTIGNALEAAEVKERLAKLDFTDTLSPSILCGMYRIKQDKALYGMANLAKEAVLVVEEVREAARRLEKASASEKQQEHELELLRNDYQDRIARSRQGKVKTVIAPIIKFRRAVAAINSTKPEAVKPLDSDLKRLVASAIKKLEEMRANDSKNIQRNIGVG